MNKNLLSDGRSHCHILRTWPHVRTKSQREYPRAMPDHSALVELICPMRGSMQPWETDALKWEEIRELCK